MRNALALAIVAAAIFVVASCWLALYPGVPVDLSGVANLDREAKRVRIPVGEDDHLDGWLLRGRRPGVVLLFHGYARDHHRMWRYAQFLRREGWTLLAVDFRSSRKHDRKPTTLGFWERLDERATLDWVRAQPEWAGQRVALFGESLGGSVALVLAAERDDVHAVVADSPFASGTQALADGCRYNQHVPPAIGVPAARLLGRIATGHDPAALEPAAALRRLGARPVLLIQSGIADRFGPEQVAALAAAGGSGTTSWTVADASHNKAWELHREEYEARVRAFLRAQLGSGDADAAPRSAPAKAAVAKAAPRRPAGTAPAGAKAGAASR